MTVNKQVDFAIGTVVSDTWLDRTQEVQAGLAWGVSLAIVGNTVTLTVPPETGSSALVIQGRMRYIEASISVSFTGADATASFGIWALSNLSDDPNPGFTLGKVQGTSNPVAEIFRKLATVSWDQSALKLSNLVQLAVPMPDGSVTTTTITDDTKKELILQSQVFS